MFCGRGGAVSFGTPHGRNVLREDWIFYTAAREKNFGF
jgi:hypothetical protein